MENATKILSVTMGTLAGLAGMEHGIGEILQGNRTPGSLVFPSWPDSAFFEILAGEPAMSIIPNFLVSGILSVLVSLVFIFWATRLVERRNTGLVLIGLSILLLLVGGGFGPPLLGVIIGAAATRNQSPFAGTALISDGTRQFTSRLWPWVLGTCLTTWLLLCPGIPVLSYFLGINDERLIAILFFTAFGFLLLSIFSGYVVDSAAGRGSADRQAAGER